MATAGVEQRAAPSADASEGMARGALQPAQECANATGAPLGKVCQLACTACTPRTSVPSAVDRAWRRCKAFVHASICEESH